MKSKRICVDLIHPAHVHVFRNAIKMWRKDGHQVRVTSRRKDCTIELLNAYNIKHTTLSKLRFGIYNLFSELICRDLKLLYKALFFKPDVLTGVAGISASHVGWAIRKPSVVFYDTEFATLSNAITYPLATVICTPECYRDNLGEKHRKYAGYHELAYLHPNRFTPDKKVIEEMGLTRPYFLLRFVSWKASHDVNEVAIPFEVKMELVNLLKQHGQVLISSECELPEEFKQYEFKSDPSLIHHVLAFANMVIGESATMASEAAMLGVPAFFIAKTDRGYTEELENKYSLVHYYTDKQSEKALAAIKQTIDTPDYLETYQERRQKMLSETVDVTQYIYDTVLAYAENGRKLIKDDN